MKRKILIATQDAMIKETIVGELEGLFDIIVADNGEKVLTLFHLQQIDFIIMDISLPRKNGYEIITEIRRVSQIPIMILTARSTIEEQVKAFELGADDYVIKPCNSKLLLAKIKRLVLRVYGESEENHELTFERLVVNKLSRTVQIDHELVRFRPKEFDLLVFLIENQSVALNRDRILDVVWGIDYFGDTRVVDTHIKKIRKKLGDYSNCIHTIFGVGYKFELV